MLTISMIVIVS